MGTRGRDQFLRLHAMCMARCTVVQGIGPICSRASIGSAIERAASDPGQDLAQATTRSLQSRPTTCLSLTKVEILFHALGAGVVMHDETRIAVLLVETKAGGSDPRRHLHRMFRRRRFAACRAPFEVATAKAHAVFHR